MSRDGTLLQLMDCSFEQQLFYCQLHKSATKRTFYWKVLYDMHIHQFIFSIANPKQLQFILIENSTLIKLSFGTTQQYNMTKLICKRMICPTQLNGEQQEVRDNKCNRQEKEKK